MFSWSKKTTQKTQENLLARIFLFVSKMGLLWNFYVPKKNI